MINSSTTHAPTQPHQREAAPPSHLMPFGVHKGTRLDELPNDYLLWLSCLNDLRQPLFGRVLRELGRRLGAIEAQP